MNRELVLCPGCERKDRVRRVVDPMSSVLFRCGRCGVGYGGNRDE